jgi:hypothetical protein
MRQGPFNLMISACKKCQTAFDTLVICRKMQEMLLLQIPFKVPTRVSAYVARRLEQIQSKCSCVVLIIDLRLHRKNVMNIHHICSASNTISAVPFHSYTQISIIINTCVCLKKNSLKRKKNSPPFPYTVSDKCVFYFYQSRPFMNIRLGNGFFHHFLKCICFKRKISEKSFDGVRMDRIFSGPRWRQSI